MGGVKQRRRLRSEKDGVLWPKIENRPTTRSKTSLVVLGVRKNKKIKHPIPAQELDEAHALARWHSTNSSLLVIIVSGQDAVAADPRQSAIVWARAPTLQHPHSTTTNITPMQFCAPFVVHHNLEKNKQMSIKEEETRD